MNDQRRKSLDEFSEESEQFESRFEGYLAGEGDESTGDQLIAEIAAWLQGYAKQGCFMPLASGDRRAARSLLESWNFRLREQGLHIEGIEALAEFDPRAGAILTADSPYPGLEPYTQTRRGSFFGRESLIGGFVTHLEKPGNRILLVIGASGSGKSSLALAGVLPRLLDLHNGDWLFAPRLTPGAHPLAELAEAIAQAVGRPGQARNIEHSLASEPDEALSRLAALCRNKPLMLFVDQFEELLTMCRDPGEQSAFAQVLGALSDPAPLSGGFSCRILLTLRTDHLARFESNKALQTLHARLVGEENERYLSAIGFDEIKRAIQKPAEEIGLRFIPASLIDRLASETAGHSNGLPLLQFALRRLWDTRPRNESDEPLDLVTEEMVKALPDVERALGAVADSIFHTFSHSQRQICERLLLELVVLDESFEEPLRRRRNDAELIEVLQARFPVASDVTQVINEFVAAGLLRCCGAEPNRQIEVAHEALLRHWDHIYRLLTGAEVKERLHLIKQIGRESGEWVEHDRQNDYLSLRGERLARAMSYAADGWLAEAEATAYVEACRGRESEVQLKEKQAKEGMERANAAQRAREAAELRAVRSRRDMWRLAGAAMVVLVAVLAWGWHRAAKESSARQVAMTAQTVAMAESNAGLSLVLYDKQKDRTYAKNAADFAKKALELNPRSDNAWFLLGVAELALKKHKEAVLAFDQVSPGSKLFADALNNAAAIDFDYLGDDQASYSRLTRAVQLKPDDMNVLSNYAESLLAAGHNDQAKLAAARARGPADAEVQGEAYVRAAMSFVMFSAELLSGNLDKALGELDEIDRHVKSAAAETKAAMEKGQSPQKWEYKGIRRSLERRLGTDSTEQRSALFTVITFIETNGKEGALDDMRRLVKTEPAKRYGSKNGIGVGLSKLEYPEN